MRGTLALWVTRRGILCMIIGYLIGVDFRKIVWGFSGRSSSKVGSDQATLELLSDYSHSFAHKLGNFGIAPDMEALKSLDWAGSGNYVFNTIDDIVEGFGIEENIPFKPSKARELFE
jgi:hypothetical protein